MSERKKVWKSGIVNSLFFFTHFDTEQTQYCMNEYYITIWEYFDVLPVTIDVFWDQQYKNVQFVLVIVTQWHSTKLS